MVTTTRTPIGMAAVPIVEPTANGKEPTHTGAREAGAGVTAGALCPRCRHGTLALRETQGGQFLVCGSCDWAALLIWQGYALEGDASQGPCPVGHVASWGVYRRFGRVDLCCLSVNGGKVCAEYATVYEGKKPTAWRGKSADGPKSKLKVLAVLFNNVESQTTSEIAAKAGLTIGQVQGCLSRCEAGAWVQRSDSPEVLARGRAFTYSLTARGRLWCRWAVAHKLYESVGEGSE